MFRSMLRTLLVVLPDYQSAQLHDRYFLLRHPPDAHSPLIECVAQLLHDVAEEERIGEDREKPAREDHHGFVLGPEEHHAPDHVAHEHRPAPLRCHRNSFAHWRSMTAVASIFMHSGQGWPLSSVA